MKRDLLTLTDLSAEEIQRLINRAIDLSKDFSSIGAVVGCRSGGLLFTPERKIAYFDFDQPTYQILAEVEEGLPGNRFNDGKCDPYGRFLIGTMQNAPPPDRSTSWSVMQRCASCWMGW